MKNEIKKDCLAFFTLQENADKAKAEIVDKIKIYAEENRRFSDGEKVLVCDVDTNTVLGTGIVYGVTNYINTSLLKRTWYNDNNMLEDHIKELRYEVFAVKVDGKRSRSHYFHAPHYIGGEKSRLSRINSFYIKKIIKK